MQMEMPLVLVEMLLQVFISNETATPLTTAGTVNNINFNKYSATGGRGYNDPELEPNSGLHSMSKTEG